MLGGIPLGRAPRRPLGGRASESFPRGVATGGRPVMQSRAAPSLRMVLARALDSTRTRLGRYSQGVLWPYPVVVATRQQPGSTCGQDSVLEKGVSESGGAAREQVLSCVYQSQRAVRVTQAVKPSC
jgi:hypothetical protein